MRLFLALLAVLLPTLCLAGGGVQLHADEPPAITAPTPQVAAEILGVTGPVDVRRDSAGIPGWTVLRDGDVQGYIGSTWEISETVGYSGRPIDVLIGVSPQGKIAGGRLVRQSEPVLTLGISEADIAAYVDSFRGLDLSGPPPAPETLPDTISRATVSSGVIRDGILRTVHTLASARGLVAGGRVDRLAFAPAGWAELIASGALAETRVGMTAAAAALAGAKVPVEPGEGDFVALWTGIIDTPAVGRNLLGQQDYTRALGALGAGDAGLIVMSSGVQSHRGTDWKRSGVFERLVVVQGDQRWQPTADRYTMIRKIVAEGSPQPGEISLFALPAAIDPTAPFTLELHAIRPAAAGGTVEMTIPLAYHLPAAFRLEPPAPPAPLWEAIWAQKKLQAGIVVAMLALLTILLFAQESVIRRPKLWRIGRLSFLAATFLVLGMGINGQLSVVQVVAFVQSLLTGFHWETFLIEPVIFLLWSFVALGLLFWGRGVYCGWLCPFGALQELLNAAAQRIGLRQIAVPQALHERLWVIKYTLFVAILALSFYSMHDAILLAEAEPFKTAISLRFMRGWPFLLFVAALLGAGLYIERFYCRYLCPLGAGLAIPAKLKIFDWLKRRPQCGRECRLCETRCTVGAIDAIGRINPNECILCLRCQVIMNDGGQCPVLKRRARSNDGGAA